jgi:hypothetical protein
MTSVKLKHDFKGGLLQCNSIFTDLNYLNKNYSVEDGAKSLANRLKYKARTKPAVYGARCATLIGVCYDQKDKLDNFERSLDMVVLAINYNSDKW